MEPVKGYRLGDLADMRAGGSENRARGRGRRRSDAPVPLVFIGKPLTAYAKDKALHQVAGEARPEGTERILTARAIDCLSIDDGELAYQEMKRELAEDAVTREGDVVLSLRAPFQTACVDAAHGGIFVTNAFAVIRCGQEAAGDAARFPLDPWFLAAYFSLGAVRESLRAMTAGERWSALKLSQLEELEIPVLDPEAQEALAGLARATAECAAERRRQASTQSGYLECAYEAALEKAGWHDGE